MQCTPIHKRRCIDFLCMITPKLTFENWISFIPKANLVKGKWCLYDAFEILTNVFNKMIVNYVQLHWWPHKFRLENKNMMLTFQYRIYIDIYSLLIINICDVPPKACKVLNKLLCSSTLQNLVNFGCVP